VSQAPRAKRCDQIRARAGRWQGDGLATCRPATALASPFRALDELGAESRGQPADVLGRVELDDLGADEVAADRVDDRQDLPHAEAAGLAMRDAGRKGRIERVEIDRHIHET